METAFSEEERNEYRIKKIANNTYYWESSHLFPSVKRKVGVRLHHTDILRRTEYTDGTYIVRVNSGGFKTRTTKDRIERFCYLVGVKLTIHTMDGLWWVFCDGKSGPFIDMMDVTKSLDNWNLDVVKKMKGERKELIKDVSNILQLKNHVHAQLVLAAASWARGREFKELDEVQRCFSMDMLKRTVRRYILCSAGHTY